MVPQCHLVVENVLGYELCDECSVELSYSFFIADNPSEQTSELFNAWSDCKGLQDI